MPAYRYKTQEQKEKHLAYRRENYRKNREHIRKRDNETARRTRLQKPEQYAAYANKFEDNPDREMIELEIAREVGEVG